MLKKLTIYSCWLTPCFAPNSISRTVLDSFSSPSHSSLRESKAHSALHYLGKHLCWNPSSYPELSQIDLDGDSTGSESDLDNVPYKSTKLFQIYVGTFCLKKSETELSKKKSFNNCGDDAFFISKGNSHTKYLGIADGVGGSGPGVSREISTSLMDSCEHIASTGNLDAASVLNQGYVYMIRKKPNVPGATTATIVSIQEDNGAFDGANFGDSGFLVIRKNASLLVSRDMLYGFNYPMQLAKDLAPANPDIYKMNLEDGDAVIIATDGLWDNLYIQDILVIANNYIPMLKASNDKQKSVAKLAQHLVREAKRRALLQKYNSPFAVKAKKADIEFITTGKNDDTTVLMAYVSKNQ